MTVQSILGIDHIIVQAGTLDELQATYQKLGFKLTDRGFHPRGSSNHTAIFDDSYLELIFVPAELRAQGGFGQDLPADFQGLRTVALKTPDALRTREELTALGFTNLNDPGNGGRPVTIKDHGTYDAKWTTQQFPADVPGLPRLFSIQHLTRDLVHRSDYRDHPNGALAITKLNHIHADPQSFAAGYRKLFGESVVSTDGTSLKVQVGPSVFQIDTPEVFAKRYPDVALPPDAEKGRIAGATLSVKSLAATTSYLKDAGLTVLRTAAGGVAVAPSEAAGVVWEFVE